MLLQMIDVTYVFVVSHETPLTPQHTPFTNAEEDPFIDNQTLIRVLQSGSVHCSPFIVSPVGQLATHPFRTELTYWPLQEIHVALVVELTEYSPLGHEYKHCRESELMYMLEQLFMHWQPKGGI